MFPGHAIVCKGLNNKVVIHGAFTLPCLMHNGIRVRVTPSNQSSSEGQKGGEYIVVVNKRARRRVGGSGRGRRGRRKEREERGEGGERRGRREEREERGERRGRR